MARYHRIRDLPEEEGEPCNKWLCGQARPVIEGEPTEEQDGDYACDYDNWKRSLGQNLHTAYNKGPRETIRIMLEQKRYNRLLAIGDIHGHLDALKTLLDKVQPTTEDKVIFLGDYVDRGPDSQGVLDELLWFNERFPQTVFIRGNHEQMFMDALTWGEICRLRDRKDVSSSAWEKAYDELKSRADYFLMKPIELERAWWQEGGRATSASFDDSLDNVRPAHRALLGQTKLFHEEWFAPDEDKSWEGEGFLFVHAGVDVKQPPQHQHPLALMNSRDFPEPGEDALWTVVHGHTVNLEGPEMMPKRINLDTGSYVKGGKLTCCDVLTRQVWQVGRSDG